MKRKVLAAMVAALFTLLLVNSAFAYTVPSDTVVYVTPTGSKYHREDCTYIKNSCRALTISSAEGQGYGACSRCEPDVLTGQYVSNWDGSGGGDGGGGGGNSSVKEPVTQKPTEKDTPLWLEIIFFLFVGPFVLFMIVTLAIEMFLMVYCVIGELLDIPKRLKEKRLAAAEQLRFEAEQRQLFEQQRQVCFLLYAGKSAEDLCGMPDWVEIGPEGLPKERGASGWGEYFTRYVSRYGKCYHNRWNCSGATIPTHVCRAKAGGRSACTRCGGTLPDLTWYTEYKKIKREKEKYGIE